MHLEEAAMDPVIVTSSFDGIGSVVIAPFLDVRTARRFVAVRSDELRNLARTDSAFARQRSGWRARHVALELR